MLEINLNTFWDSNEVGLIDRKKYLNADSYYVVRSLPNGDKFIFFELDHTLNIGINISGINDIEELDSKYQKPDYDNRYGYINLTGWDRYIKTNDYEIIFSKQYSYSTLFENESYIYELKSEKKLEFLENSKYLQALSEGNDKIKSFCILMSKDKLFNSNQSQDEYLNLFYDELKNNNAACSTWYKYDGLITKIPASIRPYSKDGYQISIHHSSKKELLHLYRLHKDRFIYNLLVNAAYTILNYQPKKDGMFFTTFTSNWLYQRYALEAPYIDTRLNETFNNAFADIQKVTGEFLNVDIFENYAVFLKAQINSVHKTKNGIFFPDYFDLDSKIITHTSLNHQLGIANYFLKVYQKNKDEQYKTLINKILNFIFDTKLSWINPENGDLFYETDTINGELVFKGSDYIFVTIADLLFFLKNYRAVIGGDLPDIVFLIDKKIKYLVNNDYDPELTSKIASGEGNNDRKQVVKFLRELDLYFLLELARKPENNYIDSINSLNDINLNKEIPSAYILYLKSRQNFVIGNLAKAEFFYRLNQILHNSSIPYESKIGKNSLFAYGGIGVILHKNSILGERCNIGSSVTIGGDLNGVPKIGNDVFISTGAKIIGNVTIGDGAIIGANAVVKHNVQPFTVVGGVPAKFLSNITSTNFSKYSGFYWCKNDPTKIKAFCDWYLSRKKMLL